MENYIKKYSINNVATPSPYDSRDWVAESIYLVGYQLPNTVDHRNKLQPIRNQGNQGSCAAQAAACMKEWQEYYDVEFNKYMSPQFIYNNRTNQDSEGMYGRDVMRILSNLGSCSEDAYPYHTIESPQDISVNIKEYYETDGIFCSFNCCKAFINDNKHKKMYNQSLTLLMRMYNEMFGVTIHVIDSAPHWRVLKEYGGNLSIIEFRNSFSKADYEEHGIIINTPSYRSIGFLYEEKIKF